ncbi:COP9 signalosome complex subunit 6 [Penicillium longicatenatum]|uniref:COP9 signalosome complex subunit 6 n=1 Tax=Penicillium longicatenatum TaxID=1561947 RepID=UPI002546D3AA|nr:COP9 signalosome complex subunit 6 [Penicillium longicatenatum]KAJ5657691.1 COP9 signalosome complex subunit 6 [Penicillium longicatenatum]
MDTGSLVSQRLSDSGRYIQLHPLVLLTISDHLTRHTARQQQGPVLGALLGQQNGQEITLEHAFECYTTTGPDGEILLPDVWFEQRLQQFKDVHKDPPLELVGWWSTAPTTGPDASHLPLHRQLLQKYNESAVFLAFHPSQLQASEAHNSKLPLTIYESVLENDFNDASKDMEIDGQEAGSLRFRELRYSVETGEAEMIGVNTIVQSSGTAAAAEIDSAAAANDTKSQSTVPSTEKGKKEEQVATKLTQEEEEMIANLNTRLNAVRILESRIALIKSYVSSISPDSDSTDSPSTTWSHPILRDVNSLISHLDIINPSDQSTFAQDVVSQHNDVLLASLFGKVGETVQSMRELGRKSAIVQLGRQTNSGRKGANPMAARFEEELFAGKFNPEGDMAGYYPR